MSDVDGRRKFRKNLPSVDAGDAFAVPLGDGRYSACRVLRRSTPADAPWYPNCVLVAGSAWIGSGIPNCDDPRIREVLFLDHHQNNGPFLRWVKGRPPAKYKRIGSIPPTPDEHAVPWNSFTSWGSFELHPMMQWRWDWDRESVLAEDRAEAEQEQREQKKAAKARKRFLATVKLKDLLDKSRFSDWKRLVKPRVIAKSNEILRSAIVKLIALSKRASKNDKMAILKECIYAFNALDATYEFIETEEREDIFEEFLEIAWACGMSECVLMANEWRVF
jgi:hypothetical protein